MKHNVHHTTAFNSRLLPLRAVEKFEKLKPPFNTISIYSRIVRICMLYCYMNV